MKRTLFLALLFLTITGFAQKSGSVVFDFSKPTLLSPSVTIPSDKSNVLVTDLVFENGPIHISFKYGSQPSGARVSSIDHNDGSISYMLEVTATTTMTFSANEGTVINRIEFNGDNTIIGDLGLADKQPGMMDYTQVNCPWTDKGSEGMVNSVSFFNNSATSKLYQIKINYTSPSDVLVPASSISSGQTIDYFREMTLTFARNINILNSSGISLTTEDGSKSWPVETKVDGNKAVLSIAEAITDNCSLKLVIPSRCFEDTEGYQNTALSYSFSVRKPMNVFNYVSASPELGRVDIIPNTFSLTFPDLVGHVSDAPLTLMKDGNAYRSVKMSHEENSKDVLFVIQNTSTDITEKGTYTITVPEGMISDVLYGNEASTYNKEFTLTYTISDPEPEPDSETLTEAKTLLTKTGVGYPSKNSPARMALQELVNTEKPSDENLQAAILDYYNETAIGLPENGKFYKLASINADGNKLWLNYSDGTVKLIGDESLSTAFKATSNADGTTVFSTDGHYLHVLVQDSKFDGTTASNVTTEYNADINDITLAKLAIADKDAKSMFGLLSMYGCLGKDVVLDDVKYAYALVSHPEGQIRTGVDYPLNYFADILTNAFIVCEVAVPVELSYTITPDKVKSNKEELTITFTDADVVSLSSTVTPYFKNANEEKVMNAVIEQKEGSTNTFVVKLDGLSNGKYGLVIPQGTFTCIVDGETRLVMSMSKIFEINENGGSDIDAEFDYSYVTYHVYPEKFLRGYVKDVDLNDFVIYKYFEYSGLVANTNKVVKLVRYDNIDDIVRTGHFEPYVIPEMPEVQAIKIVLDEPILEGQLTTAKYAFLFEPATFGDAKYGEYLEDKTSVAPNECCVNPRDRIYANVDNNKATGINDIEIDTIKNGKIYDIMGRPVNSMDKKGVYIVNGKKVVK